MLTEGRTTQIYSLVVSAVNLLRTMRVSSERGILTSVIDVIVLSPPSCSNSSRRLITVESLESTRDLDLINAPTNYDELEVQLGRSTTSSPTTCSPYLPVRL